MCHPTCVLDGIVYGNHPPMPDAQEPLSLQNGVAARNATLLVAEFTRSLASAKPNADYTIDLSRPMTVIWAYHARAPLNGPTLLHLARHRMRQAIQVNFDADGRWHCNRFEDVQRPRPRPTAAAPSPPPTVVDALGDASLTAVSNATQATT